MKVPNTLSQKIQYCWQHEKERFQFMGNYKWLSLCLFIAQFTVFPEILKMLWPYIDNDTLPKIPLYCVIIIVINIYTIGGYNAVMYVIYTKKIPFFEQFRSDPKLKWPWETNPQKWEKTWKKSVKTIVRNVLGGVIFLYIDSQLSNKIQFSLSDCPSKWTMLWQFFFYLYVGELFFYIVHSNLHNPKLYFLHKQHHEYNVSMSLTPVYSSFLEHITNVISAGITYKFFSQVYPVHIFTIIIWITYRMIQTHDGHCGYDWPWSISNWVPFCSGKNFHFFHHSNNVGNYGAIVYIFDIFLGTNKAFIEYQAREQVKQDKIGKKDS